ncbi:hypothetical protein Btru_055326 [Bulinus truncatus]|nr:hypothetical protein Btru_055326 [Bulinus truncatus]
MCSPNDWSVKVGDTGSDMEEDLKDPLQLSKELVLLIVEARTPDVSVKGRVEGPHCPVIRGRVAHKCTLDKIECIRASEFCYHTQQLCQNNIPICLDIMFFPECHHGMQESLVTEGNQAVVARENSLLIERWTIDNMRKRQDDSMSSSMLLQAVRSYLHFSQISSWLYSTGGTLPGYLVYRVYAPGEEPSLEFHVPPDKHIFPVCSTHHTEVMVSLLSLKRQPSVPVLTCALVSRNLGEAASSVRGRRYESRGVQATHRKRFPDMNYGNSVEVPNSSATGAGAQGFQFVRDGTSISSADDGAGWYSSKAAETPDGQSEDKSYRHSRDKGNLNSHPTHDTRKYSDRTSQKQHTLKDGEGGRKKNNKTKKKDGEKDERIDQRKSFQSEKYFDVKEPESAEMNDENCLQFTSNLPDVTIGQLMATKSKSGLLPFSLAMRSFAMRDENAFSIAQRDKHPAPSSEFEEVNFFGHLKDQHNFLYGKSNEMESYIGQISERLANKNSFHFKNGNAGRKMVKKKMPEPVGRAGLDSEKFSGSFSHVPNDRDGMPESPLDFSELSIMVPHVYDIFEDSDSTPVPSPNQVTISGRSREDSRTGSEVCRKSFFFNPSSNGSAISSDTFTSKMSETINPDAASFDSHSPPTVSPTVLSCNSERKDNTRQGVQSRPAAPCSRKLFKENLLPLVSYDVASDSFVQVNKSTQAKVLHSPKVLFSCDIPHDYGQAQPQKKCIDFDDTIESRFFGNKLGDVVDSNSINKYMSSLAALSFESEGADTSSSRSSENGTRHEDVVVRAVDGCAHIDEKSRQHQQDSQGIPMTNSCCLSASDSAVCGRPVSGDVPAETVSNDHLYYCTCSPSRASSSSLSPPSVPVPSSHESQPSGPLKADKSSMFVDETPSATSVAASKPWGNNTQSLSNVSDRQPLSQDALHEMNSAHSPRDCHLSLSKSNTATTIGQKNDHSKKFWPVNPLQRPVVKKPDSSLTARKGQSAHTVVHCDGLSGPQFSSLSSYCDRDPSHQMSTSSSNTGFQAARDSHPGAEDLTAVSKSGPDVTSGGTSSDMCRHVTGMSSVCLMTMPQESHTQTFKNVQNSPVYSPSLVPFEKENVLQKSKQVAENATVLLGNVNFQLCHKSSGKEFCGDGGDVVFYLPETSTAPSSAPRPLFTPESQISSASDTVAGLSLESDSKMLSKANFDGTMSKSGSASLSGSPPLHGDPPGWTSVPPHRTVSTPSCIDREERTPDQSASRPLGLMMRKCDTTSQIGLRKMAVKSVSMIFNSRTGLPTQSSPAPLKRNPGGSFDYDASLLNTRALKNAFSCSKLAMNGMEKNEENEEEKRRGLSTSAPASTNCLLGNFEESILNGRIEPVGTVDGFTAEIGASGSFCPKHLHLPVTAFFFALSEDNAPSPYLGHINLEAVNKKGYHIPKKGTVQVTLFNPNKTVVKMFVVMYDLSDMPTSSQTFIRQRTIYCPTDMEASAPSYLRYLIHLRCASSRSGKVYLHTDIRLIFARHKLDIDARNISYELKSYTEGPINPKYSPKK